MSTHNPPSTANPWAGTPASARLAGAQRVETAVRESFGAESAGDLSGEGLHAVLAALCRTLADSFKASAGRAPAWGLNFGSGVGRTTRDLAAHCATGAVGVEPHYDLLMAARQLVVDPSVRWNMADLTALPFPNAAFDLIAAVDLLSYPAPAAKALDEAVRLLAPEGILVLAESFDYPLSAAPQERWDRDGLSRQLVRRGLLAEVSIDGLAHTVRLGPRKSVVYTYSVSQFRKPAGPGPL